MSDVDMPLMTHLASTRKDYYEKLTTNGRRVRELTRDKEYYKQSAVRSWNASTDAYTRGDQQLGAICAVDARKYESEINNLVSEIRQLESEIKDYRAEYQASLDEVKA